MNTQELIAGLTEALDDMTKKYVFYTKWDAEEETDVINARNMLAEAELWSKT